MTEKCTKHIEGMLRNIRFREEEDPLVEGTKVLTGRFYLESRHTLSNSDRFVFPPKPMVKAHMIRQFEGELFGPLVDRIEELERKVKYLDTHGVVS